MKNNLHYCTIYEFLHHKSTLYFKKNYINLIKNTK
jgi:hypothetical protein